MYSLKQKNSRILYLAKSKIGWAIKNSLYNNSSHLLLMLFSYNFVGSAETQKNAEYDDQSKDAAVITRPHIHKDLHPKCVLCMISFHNVFSSYL